MAVRDGRTQTIQLELDVNTGNDESDRWYDEAHAVSNGLEPRDFDMADCAELPHEFSHHSTAAAEDDEFQTEYREWFEYLFEGDDQCLLLAIEQSCNDGMLLPWDMRAVRLRTAPPVILSQLHMLLGACLRHVLVRLVNYVYWLVRLERARRRAGQTERPRCHPRRCQTTRLNRRSSR